MILIYVHVYDTLTAVNTHIITTTLKPTSLWFLIVKDINICEQRNSQNSKLSSFWQLSTKYLPELPVSVCFQHEVLHLKSIRHLISVWIPSESVCDMKSERSLRSCLTLPIGYTFIPLSAADHPQQPCPKKVFCLQHSPLWRIWGVRNLRKLWISNTNIFYSKGVCNHK